MEERDVVVRVPLIAVHVGLRARYFSTVTRHHVLDRRRHITQITNVSIFEYWTRRRAGQDREPSSAGTGSLRNSRHRAVPPGSSITQVSSW
eukprot:3941930-Rhodomonas_salina.9